MGAAPWEWPPARCKTLRADGTPSNQPLVWRRRSFHSENAGKLAKRDEAPLFVPCTPKGIIELLKHNGGLSSRMPAVA